MKLQIVFELADMRQLYIIYSEESMDPIFCGSFAEPDCYASIQAYLNSEATDAGMSGSYRLVKLEGLAR